MPDSIDSSGAVPSEQRRTAGMMRASDAQRLATVQILQDAVARGLLTPAEGSERMADAFAAVHLHDLDPLTEDLPPAPSATRPPTWRTLIIMFIERLQSSIRAISSGKRPALIGAALLITFLLVTLGVTAAYLLFDIGARPDRDGFGTH